MKPWIRLAGALVLGASLVQAQAQAQGTGPPPDWAGWEPGVFGGHPMGFAVAAFWDATGEPDFRSRQLVTATLAERTRYAVLSTNMGAYGILRAVSQVSFEWYGGSHGAESSPYRMNVADRHGGSPVSYRELIRERDPYPGGNSATSGPWKHPGDFTHDGGEDGVRDGHRGGHGGWHHGWPPKDGGHCGDAPLRGAGCGSSTVPEPASLGLLVLGAGLLMTRRQRIDG